MKGLRWVKTGITAPHFILGSRSDRARGEQKESFKFRPNYSAVQILKKCPCQFVTADRLLCHDMFFFLLHQHLPLMFSEFTPLQQNLQLKHFFSKRNLDLEVVMDFTPDKLAQENAWMSELAMFLLVYEHFGSREAWEREQKSWVFPPVRPRISPDMDWERFENWYRGQPVELSLGEMIKDPVPFRQPDDIPDHEIKSEARRLRKAVERAGINVALKKMPPRLYYTYLHKKLEDVFPLGVGWTIDGCNGDCEHCVQLPYCDTGQELTSGDSIFDI